jgi:hypothetical protein
VILEAADEQAAVDEIEFLRVCPVVFNVIDFERAVWWNTRFYQPCSIFSWSFTDKFGWIGLRSFPITCAEGNLNAGRSQRVTVILDRRSHQNLSPISQSPFPYLEHFADSDLLVPGIAGPAVPYTKRDVAYLEETLAGLLDSYWPITPSLSCSV